MSNNFTNYFKRNTTLDNNSIEYIYSIFNINDNIENVIYRKYLNNKKIVSKYYPNIKCAEKYDGLLKVLSSKYSYSLFECINSSNVDYYSSLWYKMFN